MNKVAKKSQKTRYKGLQEIKNVRNVALGVGVVSGGFLAAKATRFLPFKAIVPIAMLILTGTILIVSLMQGLLRANAYLERQLQQAPDS